jgi:hypothetical protein
LWSVNLRPCLDPTTRKATINAGTTADNSQAALEAK